jgi:hypothetical protein
VAVEGIALCTGVEVLKIAIVRPSLLKVAISGAVAFTVTTAEPLLSP